jgi:SAM-dependent methyltransferase
MKIAATWPAKTGDSCADFFGTCLRAFDPDIPSTASVLEIGCAEYDWLTPAHRAWPEMTLIGIDWRGVQKAPVGARVVEGDARDPTHFAPESFDWIVSISAIEHMGLGHYAKDPKDENGDVRVMANAWQWLTPGGYMYVDVPWNAGVNAYQVCGTSHRVYDDAAIARRFLATSDTIRWRGVCTRKRTQTLLMDTPRLSGGEDFYYIGLWLQKPSGG